MLFSCTILRFCASFSFPSTTEAPRLLQDRCAGLQAGLVRIYRTLQRLDQLIGPDKDKGTVPLPSSLSAPEKDSFLDQFVQTMDDDLNTANAVALLFEKVKEMNKTMDSPSTNQAGPGCPWNDGTSL